MENDGGCFVTKVAPGGSAARSGGVEVGDQLAAINGSSGIRMKVEDISDMISKSANPDRIELVFVRYIGPFCPIRKSGLRIVGPGHVGNTTEHSPASIKPRSAGQLISEYAPQEQAQKKKGFRLFGRTKRRVSKRVV